MIHWLPVEGYFNQRFIASHQIRLLKVRKTDMKNHKPDATHQVTADVAADVPVVVLKTGSESTCNLFLTELLKQTGKVIEPFAKFGPEKKAPTESSTHSNTGAT